MARKKSTNPRTEHIDTRLTKDEYDTIKFKAASTGVSASEYLRRLGVNYSIKSMVDQLAVDELIKAKNDLGRLGGLFKKWLVDQEGRTGNIGSRNYEEINSLVNDLEEQSKKLLEIAKEVMNKKA